MQTSDLAGEKLNKIPTALELLRRDESGVCTEHDIVHMMIKFAKIHVQEALKQASEKARLHDKVNPNDTSIKQFKGFIPDKDSILNSYPLTNIK